MIKKEDIGFYLTQVQTDVTFTAFMTAVVMFFTGLLLTKFESFDITIKVPISFLIISMFGFLYSTLILSNASGEISGKKFEKAQKHIFYGYVVAEYIGIYLLVISLPLVINVITGDVYLRIVTLISSLLGFGLYHFFHFSIIEKHFKERYGILSGVFMILGLVLFLAQIYNYYFVTLATATLTFILLVIFFAVRKRKF